MEKKYPKSALKFFFKLHITVPVSGLSNEILCILVAQENAKLPKVKVVGLKKILPLGLICTTRLLPLDSSPRFFFGSLTLNSGSFAVLWDTKM